MIEWVQQNWLAIAGAWKLCNIAIVAVKTWVESDETKKVIHKIKDAIAAIIGLKKK